MQQNPTHTLVSGSILNGKYKILSVLGFGGFGITYKVEHTYLHETKVIKEFFLSGKCVRATDSKTVETQALSPGDFGKFKESFLAEARMLSRLKHVPHTVPIADFFEENNTAYIVLPFIDAEDLGVKLQKQTDSRLSEPETLRIFAQVATALQATHTANVIHRDLKPANILIDKQGDAYLIDFGASREFIAEGLTQTMTAILTPGFAPLEQYSDRAKRGPTMDIYALGALLYRMLVGKNPPNAVDIASSGGKDLIAPHLLRPEITPHVSAVILKAMAIRPEDRYPSVAEMRAALAPQKTAATQLPPTIVPQAPETVVAPTKLSQNNSVKQKETGGNLHFQRVVILGLIFFIIALMFFLFLDQYKKGDFESTTTPTTTTDPFAGQMVYIRGGTFQMGSEAGEDDEIPVHTRSVGSFYMSKYEVTQAQWRSIMGTNPSNFNNCDRCPVEQVSWNDVQTFIQKLNAQTGKNYRLPTEAEWEYAAKGGQSYKYAGSDNIGSVAWYDGNSGSKTHPVGQKQANAYGLYDMSGNVYEWCSDWYKGYPGSSGVSDYTGSLRVLRGGGWYSGSQYCRVALRNNYAPASRGYYIGFRLVSSQ